jgi:D-3-phosphoglycerate dehydrogenase
MTPNRKRLVFFERWIHPDAEPILAARSDIDVTRLHYGGSPAENDAAMALAHAYQIAPRTELQAPWLGDATLIARCPNLLAISSTGAGFDMVDVDACTAAGIIVCNQSGTNKNAVAEHALALMLILSRKIMVSDRRMRDGGDLDRFGFQGRDLRAKTVGLVGIGQIGARVAELCSGPLGMNVMAYDPYVSAETIRQRGAAPVDDLGALLAQVDFVSVHCPRNQETLGLFGAAQFRQMQPSAYFINTARGGIHDEDALADALEAGVIAGAGLDVFLHEPVRPDHRLLRFDNVVSSPHLAGMTVEAMRDMAVAAAQQWITILEGAAPPRIVNPEVWPRYAERFEAILGFKPVAALP